MNLLRPEYFHSEQHQRIFAATTRLHAREEPVDLVTLSNALRESNDLERAGGEAYLTKLVDDAVTAANVEHHARIVADHAARRQIISGLQAALDYAGNGAVDATDLRQFAITKVSGEGSSFSVGREKKLLALTPQELLADGEASCRDWLVEGLIERRGSGITTGRPKGLKSWFELFRAMDAASGRPVLGRFAVPHPVRVLYFSEEDPRSRTADRFRRIVLGRDGRGPSAEYLRVICRSGFTPQDPDWFDRLRRLLTHFQPRWSYSTYSGACFGGT